MGIAAESGGVLAEVERLRRMARGERRASSVPLLAFGVLTLGYVPLAGQLSLLSLVYWSVVAPVGFLLVALSLFRFDGHHRCGGQAASAVSYSAGLR